MEIDGVESFRILETLEQAFVSIVSNIFTSKKK